MNGVPDDDAALTTRRASAAVVAMGLSSTKGLPARETAFACSACNEEGLAMTTRS